MTPSRRPRPSGRRSAYRIRDGRGRRVTQVDPVLQHWRMAREPIPPEPLAKIIEAIGPGLSRGLHRAMVLGGLGVGLAFSIITVRLIWSLLQGTASWSLLADRIPVFIGVGAGLGFAWWTAFVVRHRRVAAVMLEHRRCPHCAYDLSGLPPDEDDGLTVCPECGCAWKVEDELG